MVPCLLLGGGLGLIVAYLVEMNRLRKEKGLNDSAKSVSEIKAGRQKHPSGDLSSACYFYAVSERELPFLFGADLITCHTVVQDEEEAGETQPVSLLRAGDIFQPAVEGRDHSSTEHSHDQQ